MSSPAVSRDCLSDDPEIDDLVGLLGAAAADAPTREFLRFEESSWSFGDIDTLTSQLANYLVDELGIRPGDRVAIMLPNIVHWPVAWLGILKAGAVAVPVNFSYLVADLEHVLEDSAARAILTVADTIPLLQSACRDRALAIVDATAIDLASRPAARPDVHVDGATLANLQYTSGTTGLPKACMLPHDYWARLGRIAAGIADLTADDVALTSAPYSYIDAQWNTVMCIIARATLVVLPRFSASGFFADVRRHGVTFFYVLGTMPTLLYKQPPHPDDLENNLRLVTCSAIPAALHADLETRWGAPWRETYGMTESGVDLVSYPEDVHLVGSGLIGRAVPGKQVRIVDDEGNDVAPGETGEMLTSGRPVMLGYWNRPEATAEVLSDGWLHTGDLVRHDSDGYVQLVGRKKDMVRRGGENVACAEVEEVLTGHDDVVAAAVVAVPDELFGEESKAFIQLVDPDRASEAEAIDVLDHARARLARFKIPRYVEFVADFPMTPSERIAKVALQERAAASPGRTFDLQSSRRTETTL